jgi:hypothetical protein
MYRTRDLVISELRVLRIIRTRARFVIFAILVILGCDVPELPQIITISKAPVFRPSSPQEIDSLEQAMATIMTVSRDNLDLPAADPITIHLYKNTKSFGILFGRNNWMDVEGIGATAKGRHIHIDLEAIGGRPWREQIWLLAHEYAHNMQYAVAGDKGGRIIWFAEGFAEWTAAKVLDSLQWQDYSVALHGVQRELSRHKELLPALSSLRDSRGWDLHLRKPKGEIRTYRLAFAAVDRIITEKGLSSALLFLKSGDFGESFGESQENFEVDFEKSLPATPSSNATSFSFAKPDWKVGDEWTYAEKRFGKRATVVKRVIRKDSFDGVPAFVVKVNDEEHFFSEKTLALVAIQKNGTPILVQSKSRFIDWPLKRLKEWRIAYTRENFEAKIMSAVDYLMFVSGIESIQVPAGTFDAIKIEGYGYETGRLAVEYWYSPEVKWLVKSRSHRLQGLVEEELMEFKIG